MSRSTRDQYHSSHASLESNNTMTFPSPESVGLDVQKDAQIILDDEKNTPQKK